MYTHLSEPSLGPEGLAHPLAVVRIERRIFVFLLVQLIKGVASKVTLVAVASQPVVCAGEPAITVNFPGLRATTHCVRGCECIANYSGRRWFYKRHESRNVPDFSTVNHVL